MTWVTLLLSRLREFASQPWLLLVLFIIFILLNILDGHSTWLVLRPHHYSRERNPIARWIFRKLGIPLGIVIFKVVLLAILTAAFAWYARHEILILNVVLAAANLIFFAVVLHNYRVCRKLGINPLPSRRQR